MSRLGRDAQDWHRAEQRTELRHRLAEAIYTPPRQIGLLRWTFAPAGNVFWWATGAWRGVPGSSGVCP